MIRSTSLTLSLVALLSLFSMGCDLYSGIGMNAIVQNPSGLKTSARTLDINMEIPMVDETQGLDGNYVIQGGAQVVEIDGQTHVLVTDLLSSPEMSAKEKKQLLNAIEANQDIAKQVRIAFFDPNTSEQVGSCQIESNEDFVLAGSKVTLNCKIAQ